jgi:hypothetical protein
MHWGLRHHEENKKVESLPMDVDHNKPTSEKEN